MIYKRICQECGKPFETTYGRKMRCSRPCTVAYNNHKKYNVFAEGKIKCLMCGGWYVKVLAHVWQVHKLGQNEYREHFDLPLKRGMIPDWHKKILADNVRENGTIENLKKGAGRRFVKGDPRAKAVTGWKGRAGSKGFTGY